MAKMKTQFMDMIKDTDRVVFNRCKEGDPLPAYRRGIKVANQGAEVIFEDEEGELDDIFQDEMPFDIDAPVIQIAPAPVGRPAPWARQRPGIWPERWNGAW